MFYLFIVFGLSLLFSVLFCCWVCLGGFVLVFWGVLLGCCCCFFVFFVFLCVGFFGGSCCYFVCFGFCLFAVLMLSLL